MNPILGTGEILEIASGYTLTTILDISDTYIEFLAFIVSLYHHGTFWLYKGKKEEGLMSKGPCGVAWENVIDGTVNLKGAGGKGWQVKKWKGVAENMKEHQYPLSTAQNIAISTHYRGIHGMVFPKPTYSFHVFSGSKVSTSSWSFSRGTRGYWTVE